MFVRPALTRDQHGGPRGDIRVLRRHRRPGGPDNLGTGVTKPDRYDPKISRAYAELADYYGVLVDPARAGHPKDKPWVERPMPCVRDSFWRGRDWASEADTQRGALRWCIEMAGARH